MREFYVEIPGRMMDQNLSKVKFKHPNSGRLHELNFTKNSGETADTRGSRRLPAD
jgi:hypothetical protein